MSDRDKREKVIKGLEYCIDYAQRVNDLINDVPCEGCPYVALKPIAVGQGDCIDSLFKDALALLKAQEPRVMTLEDFENNPNVDQYGCLPCWMEYREEPKWDGWAEATVHTCVEYGRRPWTSRPSDEVRRATPWND